LVALPSTRVPGVLGVFTLIGSALANVWPLSPPEPDDVEPPPPAPLVAEEVELVEPDVVVELVEVDELVEPPAPLPVPAALPPPQPINPKLATSPLKRHATANRFDLIRPSWLDLQGTSSNRRRRRPGKICDGALCRTIKRHVYPLRAGTYPF